jgi:hypothetical protein
MTTLLSRTLKPMSLRPERVTLISTSHRQLVEQVKGIVERSVVGLGDEFDTPIDVNEG